MILGFDAVVTYSTMMTTRGSPYIASLAIFGGYLHGGCCWLSRFDHSPVVHGRGQSERIFILLRRWHRVEISGKNLEALVSIGKNTAGKAYPRIRNRSVDEGRHANIKNIGKYNGYRWRNVVP
jgi:hypothetical protein